MWGGTPNLDLSIHESLHVAKPEIEMLIISSFYMWKYFLNKYNGTKQNEIARRQNMKLESKLESQIEYWASTINISLLLG